MEKRIYRVGDLGFFSYGLKKKKGGKNCTIRKADSLERNHMEISCEKYEN